MAIIWVSHTRKTVPPDHLVKQIDDHSPHMLIITKGKNSSAKGEGTVCYISKAR